ncbi:2-oxo-4-hydroxy-4-carboxy-5-ureidoimidazoline decarboxylase [Halothiobacillus neapolitanus]|uniref:2-oxo-4-hydroxy-4-carboxy-5-ureidoimidazoline decarboxylase n=1 Tax=Halothiobacillus neapolitanus (strain ATCC 23641 / DSM 15147 / CIP 104769 / NCIMB 8539 / c2) TaxID=555778 RepID=D0KZ09_HALNC|nr:2-oxo-4-hydroxy-4-carboxy-5-ureidoimidazoline decarboxylase [Halothiobacillus neapolitanus]ACX95682.1 OHCU decarboxylase [Halothiobacillus neapolitanus c2]TDN65988.1 2-oxo-4-hydroxy-4-carboxy-5-ureidoimidazoline decarboxylase [Halothiobacillus neapolitanus]
MSMTIVKINGLSAEAFVADFKPLLEHAEWAIDRLAASRPFANHDDLNQKIAEIVRSADAAEKRSALIHHPKLGSGVRIQGFSSSEQSQAGLHALTADEFAQFEKDNVDYEQKMGFPFVVAVTGLDKQEIMQLLELRMKNDPSVEFVIAIDELIKIACIRVAKLVPD